MTRNAKPAALLGISALTLLTALVASCGDGGAANTAASPSSSAGSASPSPSGSAEGTSPSGTDSGPGTQPSTAGLAQTSAKPAGLPTAGYDYGDLLLKAWAKGDRKAAARYATPDAALALFNHKPVAKLVNFECDDEDPVVCGWIGTGDARVMLGLDKKRLSRGALQAVVAAKVTTD